MSTTNFTYRLATPDDIPALKYCAMRAFDETFRGLDEVHNDENVDQYINSTYEPDVLHREMTSPHGLYYIVIHNDLYDKYQQQQAQQQQAQQQQAQQQQVQDLDSHPQHYIIAYLKLSWDTEQTEDEFKSFDNYLQLQRIYVRKAFQGQKIGLALFHHTLAFAQKAMREDVGKAAFGTHSIEPYQTHQITSVAQTATAATTTTEQKDEQQQQQQQHKFHKIWLTVYPPNIGPIKFYQRCGFAKSGEYDFWINGVLTIDWVMTLDVNQ